jgi:hypothetical protein
MIKKKVRKHLNVGLNSSTDLNIHSDNDSRVFEPGKLLEVPLKNLHIINNNKHTNNIIYNNIFTAGTPRTEFIPQRAEEEEAVQSTSPLIKCK